ncbi:hypothetical protein MMC06_000661, partial [Schaereria dolodes]|nr:hypothetical protein [Schaereria dolodes]
LFVLPHHTSTSTRPSPHPFAGFYIRYPTSPSPSTSPSHPPPLGLVSTISTSPPLLNWIYIRADTAEVRYGNRTESIVHRVGQWGWVDGDDDDDEGGGESESEGDGGLTLDGREGWVVVEPRGRSGGGGEEGVQGEEGREEVDVNVNVNVNEGEGEEEEGEELWEIRWDENDDLLKGVGAVEGRRVLRISLERRFLDRGEEEGKKEEVEREKGVRGEGVGGG